MFQLEGSYSRFAYTNLSKYTFYVLEWIHRECASSSSNGLSISLLPQSPLLRCRLEYMEKQLIRGKSGGLTLFHLWVYFLSSFCFIFLNWLSQDVGRSPGSSIFALPAKSQQLELKQGSSITLMAMQVKTFSQQ